MSPEEIRQRIHTAIPTGRVIPAHTDRGHFYEIHEQEKDVVTYPSVTGKLGMLKDDSIKNFQTNRAMDYVFAHWKQFTDDTVMEHIDHAKRAGIIERDQAGHIGKEIHDYREAYFSDWINTGIRPTDIRSYIPPDKHDIRAVSALRAMDKFIDDYEYIPVVCELFVYSHKWKTAGTLDDIGIVNWPLKNRGPREGCRHNLFYDKEKNYGRCIHCEYKYRKRLALMDLKTSNQFKDHYFLQVAMYWDFFKALVPNVYLEKALILKTSKENGTYKIEDLKHPNKIATSAKNMLRAMNGIDNIKSIRKDNQKHVLEI